MELRTPEQRARDVAKRDSLFRERRALAQSYLLTFGTETGKAVLADLEREGKVFEPLFGFGTTEPVDPIRLAALEGRRQVLLYIKGMIGEAITGA